MKLNTFTPMVYLLIAVLLFTTGCSALSPKPASLSDEEVVAVTENILKSIDTGDYSSFLNDFSEEMVNAFPEGEFEEMQVMLAEASGAFQSCGEPKLINQQDFAVYRIPCTYQKEEVTVTVVFEVDGSTVEGLYFDSPNLRTTTNQ